MKEAPLIDATSDLFAGYRDSGSFSSIVVYRDHGVEEVALDGTSIGDNQAHSRGWKGLLQPVRQIASYAKRFNWKSQKRRIARLFYPAPDTIYPDYHTYIGWACAQVAIRFNGTWGPASFRGQQGLREVAWGGACQYLYGYCDIAEYCQFVKQNVISCLQRFFSQMVINFHLQALLIASNFGAKKFVPAALLLQWLLKDGIKPLLRMLVTAFFSTNFDAKLKRVRWTSTWAYGVLVVSDFLTPFWPTLFLPLTMLANMGRAIGLSTHVATNSAIMRSLSRGENLAHVMGKMQALMMLVDLSVVVLCSLLLTSLSSMPYEHLRFVPIVS